MECPNCGTDIPARDGRCDECGALIALTYQCPSCGTGLKKYDERCPKCGQEILVEAPQEPSKEPAAPKPKARPKKPAKKPAQKPRRTGRRRSLPILLVGVVILCCVCLVIAGGVGAFIVTTQGTDLTAVFGSWSQMTVSQPEISLTPAPSDVFEVVSSNSWIDEKDVLNLAGVVHNISGQAIATVVIMDVALFDKDGRQIGTAARASLQRPKIEVDGSSPFWIMVSDAELAEAGLTDVASYTLNFTLTGTPRTEVELLVLDSTENTEGGSLVVKGDVQNNSGLGVSNVGVYVILYGGGGEVLSIFSQGSIVARQLAPDETAPFEIELSRIYGEAESYDILAVGTPTE